MIMVWMLSLVAYVWGGWGLYVLMMAIYRLHLAKKLTTTGYVLAAPFALTGFVLDVLGNFTLCWLLFLDWPREWTITGRMQRYIRAGKGWRHDVSCWICKHALDPFDANGGAHC